ncbi:phytoene dehydrogenase-like protein [Nocardiopsis arvandica]|uniref:Phytoene dehydrogenase-like protein n=1 Tax=Nocardiopsis sinuspersici TaxID=501010 RepID=A0A7Z0BKM6_9ACTN|nr:FAD-dependent oxidoreductase [Nocardiopsis sinuspersici]NYH53340.1 phytoene dehydrogenase-like protein [Nocardiopsis sinuspersici]
MDITVVGGGLAGLTAAIASAERGANVTLLEAHRALGGRARATDPPYVANEGPHVLYGDGAPFTWLAERDLVPPSLPFPARGLARMRVRHRGRVGMPPAALLRAAARRRLRAPHDRDFGSWAGEELGEEPARVAANLMGVVLFDSDPSRLSAAFVWERFRRATAPAWPSPKYLVGGWTSLVERLARRAREMGVRVETGARVDAVPDTPTIVATSLASARALLGDDSLEWESGHTLMVDLGLWRGRDPFVVFDTDECGFLERYSLVDHTLAPEGEELVQAQLPVRSGESRSDVTERMERFLDLSLPGWRERVTWRRDQVARGRTGALDLPGRTWRDRPAVDRGEGLYLVGDSVAAPGLLGEVAFNSAVAAAEAATGRRSVGAA